MTSVEFGESCILQSIQATMKSLRRAKLIYGDCTAKYPEVPGDSAYDTRACHNAID